MDPAPDQLSAARAGSIPLPKIETATRPANIIPNELLAAFRPPLVAGEESPRALRKPPIPKIQSRSLPQPPAGPSIASSSLVVPVASSLSVPAPSLTQSEKSSSFEGSAALLAAEDLSRSGRPANIWASKKRRGRFQHLLEQPGGGRDISFLYDATMRQPGLPPLGPTESVSSFEEHLTVATMAAPQSIALEEDKYTVRAKGDRPVPLPMLGPTGRADAKIILREMDSMLDRAGLNDTASEDGAPTAVHALLELVRKEQNIYEACFAELIRQVSIECVERGQALANLRTRYSGLLSRIPRQVVRLHDELTATRTLARRMLTELVRFRDAAKDLVGELGSVKGDGAGLEAAGQLAGKAAGDAMEHATHVSRSLADIQYLYDLQRNRLEAQIASLTEENKLWYEHACTLALKMAEKDGQRGVQRLRTLEKAWVGHASHFVAMVADADAGLMTTVFDAVDTFLAEGLSVVENLTENDYFTTHRLAVFSALWSTCTVQLSGNAEGRQAGLEWLRGPGRECLTDLGELVGKYIGEGVDSTQSLLRRLSLQRDRWTDAALRLFGRHGLVVQGATEADLTGVNGDVAALLEIMRSRIGTESQTADRLMTLASNMEDTVLAHAMCADTDSVGIRIVIDRIEAAITLADAIRAGMSEKIDVKTVHSRAHAWAEHLQTNVDSVESGLLEQVHRVEKSLSEWLILYQAAVTTHNNSDAIRADVAQSKVFNSLESFTNQVVGCVSDIVANARKVAIEKGDIGESDFHADTEELATMQSVRQEWGNLSSLLSRELLASQRDAKTITASTRASSRVSRRNQAVTKSDDMLAIPEDVEEEPQGSDDDVDGHKTFVTLGLDGALVECEVPSIEEVKNQAAPPSSVAELAERVRSGNRGAARTRTPATRATSASFSRQGSKNLSTPTDLHALADGAPPGKRGWAWALVAAVAGAERRAQAAERKMAVSASARRGSAGDKQAMAAADRLDELEAENSQLRMRLAKAQTGLHKWIPEEEWALYD
eukprot:m.222245 g.222245  ORF g.222245 m.222245 type:complete len:1005 (+) comp10732_c0_seq1:42-3056(+)